MMLSVSALFLISMASASPLALMTACSASVLILSRSYFALRAFCSATCFSSMALSNAALKVRSVMLRLSTNMYLSSSRSLSISLICEEISLRRVMVSSAVYWDVTDLMHSDTAGAIMVSS